MTTYKSLYHPQQLESIGTLSYLGLFLFKSPKIPKRVSFLSHYASVRVLSIVWIPFHITHYPQRPSPQKNEKVWCEHTLHTHSPHQLLFTYLHTKRYITNLPPNHHPVPHHIPCPPLPPPGWANLSQEMGAVSRQVQTAQLS
jgi:hypothetical protein